MDNNIVEYYTWNILKKQLQKFKISNTALYNIISNVKEQLYSIIVNWNDVEFRNAVLILGSEEATFYEPKNDIIANMVVVAIRNSLLEGVSSDSYRDYGSSYRLNDSSIKIITGEAIKYFSQINLEEKALEIECEYDFYKEVSKKYPVAFKALTELSKCSEKDKEHSYKKLENIDVYELEELENFEGNDIKEVNCESGISPEFNTSLCILLNGIKNKESEIFFTDCFKMTTRNFEKILKILEFILTHDGMFVTCNYLLTKDYVSRREKLLRASHTSEEFFGKIEIIPEVSEKYKKRLEEALQLNS